MSGLSVPGFQSATGATAAIYAQSKKAVGNVTNTFAAIGGHGSAAVKARWRPRCHRARPSNRR